MGDKYEYLDEERKKLWGEVRNLENEKELLKTQIGDLTKRLTEIEDAILEPPQNFAKDAENASRETSKYYNRVKSKETEINNLFDAISADKEKLDEMLLEMTHHINQLEEQHHTVEAQMQAIKDAYNMVAQSGEEWKLGVANLDANYKDSETWLTKAKERFQAIQQTATTSGSILTKIDDLLNQSADKKQNISDLYDKIFGYDLPSESGNGKKHERGLKDNLDDAYAKLEAQIADFSKKLDGFKAAKENAYDDFLHRKEQEHDAIKKKITELLPDALTAGLSHAYEKKRKEEQKSRANSLKIFYRAVIFMTAFSFIPFILGLIFRYNLNKSWEDVVTFLPQIACVMLPLYLPAFWVAFSASRKANLAKRLAEEYAHKETLSKTFQGLEEQISRLDNSETAAELKIKLLYNLVSVSAENPGKLIPNYNKADNPLMEFLDKSIAVSESLDKLKNIPGANIIAERILAKQEKRREKIAEEALDATNIEGVDA